MVLPMCSSYLKVKSGRSVSWSSWLLHIYSSRVQEYIIMTENNLLSRAIFRTKAACQLGRSRSKVTYLPTCLPDVCPEWILICDFIVTWTITHSPDSSRAVHVRVLIPTLLYSSGIVCIRAGRCSVHGVFSVSHQDLWFWFWLR